MENFIPEQLNENIIYQQFDYIKSPDETKEQYHSYANLFKDSKEKTDIYFESGEKKIKEAQIEVFKRFIQSFEVADLEAFFKVTYSDKEFTYYHKGKISRTYLEVISLPFETDRFDLILICSKEYRQSLINKKTISIRFELLNNKIKSAERTTNTTLPNDHARIIKQYMSNQNDIIDGWYLSHFPYIEKYLKHLNQKEVEDFVEKIWQWDDEKLSLIAHFLHTYHKPYLDNNYIYCKAFSLINTPDDLDNLIENLYVQEQEAAAWEPELLIRIKEKAVKVLTFRPELQDRINELIKIIDNELGERNSRQAF